MPYLVGEQISAYIEYIHIVKTKVILTHLAIFMWLQVQILLFVMDYTIT